ncbi:Phenazine biosynthesis PhzC/PhzF protein [Pleurostoma richardsiae]|uniref:Phenazine biosynthesis PhzC/PhzF protein n=1 Tax=Pleurostoma richardsiae TaxID=41990 RepID=A0AA38VLU8_9PEZI|nr:Phenazine biosynthesis PhzC/PhzF protein [Pleurostoma richardsiae]
MASPLYFYTLDVFTSTPFLGNPLGLVVVPASQTSTLTQGSKQRIAREFNLSETVFLHLAPGETLSAPDASLPARRLDIFTIESELPFAGHPTIGTAFFVLRHLRWAHVTTLQTKAGPICIEAVGGAGGTGAVRATIPHDVHVHARTLRDVEAADPAAFAGLVRPALSADPALAEAELDAPLVSIVRGMTFALVRLPGAADLAGVSAARRLDFGALGTKLLDEGPWAESFVARYYYAPAAEGESEGGGQAGKVRLRSRMVELSFEDPATGSAACTLSSYLALKGQGAKGRLGVEITQGVEMGRKSDIEVEVAAEGEGESRKVTEVFLGGEAVVVMKGELQQ